MKHFPALAHAPFRWFISGQVFSVIGIWAQNAALAWYVQTLTATDGSEEWLGILGAVSSLPILLFSTWGGAAADHWPRRTLVIITQMAGMFLAMCFGLLVIWGVASLEIALLFAALNGTILAFDIPARQAFAMDMVGRGDLLNAIALNSSVFNLGRVIGPMIAGVFMVTVGVAACFFMNGASFLGVIVALYWMKLPTRAADAFGPRESAAARNASKFWRGFATVLGEQQLWGLMLVLCVMLVTGGAYLTLLPAVAANALRLDELGYSILLTSNGLGGLLGALLVAGLRGLPSRQPAMLLGLLTMGLGMVGLAFASLPSAAYFAVLWVGAGFVIFLTSANSTLQLSVPDSVRGRVMSVWVLAFGLCQPIGSYCSGQIAASLGLRVTLFLEAGGCFAAAFLALLLLRGQQTHAPLESEPTHS